MGAQLLRSRIGSIRLLDTWIEELCLDAWGRHNLRIGLLKVYGGNEFGGAKSED